MGRRDEDEGLSPRARARLRSRTPWPAAAPRSGEAAAASTPLHQFVPGPEDLVADLRQRAGPRPPGGGAPPATGRHRRARLPGRGWLRLPASFVGARWQPGRAGVVGFVAVAVLAVLVFGVRVAWARSAAEPAVVAPGGGDARAGPEGISAGAAPVGLDGPPASSVPPGGASPTEVGAGAGGDADAGDGPVGATKAVVVVHVVGEVRDPGVQRLPPGSRVSDAVAAAGGPTRRADLGGVNLARLVVDGEQVRVPAPGEVVVAGGASAGPVPGGVAGAGGGGTGGPVSLNTADQPTLETLPGVGPVLAQRIVEWRTAHGGFTSVDELTEVSGIGEKTFEQLRPLVSP